MASIQLINPGDIVKCCEKEYLVIDIEEYGNVVIAKEMTKDGNAETDTLALPYIWQEATLNV